MTHLDQIKTKLQTDDFEITKDSINGIEVDIAMKQKFKLAWFATQMNSFAIIGKKDKITKDEIESYAATCMDYAISHNKGLPRGMQSGVAAFALLASENIDEQAKKFAQTRPKKHFAAFEIPILLDLKENKIYFYNKTPLWGLIYYKAFRQFIDKYFNPQS